MSISKPENATIGDVVTTFMYASAVNVVLAHSVVMPEIATAWVPLTFILFLVIDWLSRIRIPIGFPEKDQEVRRRVRSQLIKGAVEIACVFVLVLAAVSRFVPNAAAAGDGRWRTLMLFFFSASFLWNLIALGVMTHVGYRDLLRAAIAGSVFEITELRSYTKRFWQPFDQAMDELEKEVKPGCAFAKVEEVNKESSKLGVGRAVAQLIALHVTVSNVAVAILLLAGVENILGIRDIIEQTEYGPALRLALGCLVVLLPAAVFSLVSHQELIARRKGQSVSSGTTVLRIAGGVFGLLLLLAFYMSFSLDVLVWVLLGEHAVFGIFMQFVDPLPSTPASAGAYPLES